MADEEVPGNDGVDKESAPADYCSDDPSLADCEPIPITKSDAEAGITDEDQDWFEDLVISNVEVAGALNASIGSILDVTRTAVAFSEALNASGITKAYADILDTQRTIAGTTIAALIPSQSVSFFDSAQASAALGITNAFASLTDFGPSSFLGSIFEDSQIAASSAFAALAPSNGLLGSLLDNAPITNAFAGLADFTPSSEGFLGSALNNASISAACAFTSVSAGLPDSTQMATALSAAINASGIVNAYTTAMGDFPGTSRIATTLSSALCTSGLAAAINALQDSIISWSSMSKLAGTPGPFTGLDDILEEQSVLPYTSSNIFPQTASDFHEEWKPQEFAARLVRTASCPSAGDVAANEAVTLSWIKRYNQELTLAITVLALVVAVLAWLFPRSTPTPVQVKLVWTIVQSCLGTHGAIAPLQIPAGHVVNQPAKGIGSR
jgi:hypothetical protein